MILPFLFLSRLATVLLPVLLLVAAAACGGGRPEELDIPVKLGQEGLSPETIRVKQGDMVTLKIEAAEPGEVHLHGYDIAKDVEAGAVTDLFFLADATGRFQITFHEDGGGHGEIFKSKKLQPGDAFTYQVADHLEGSVVSYHSHLRPAVAGSIKVWRDAPSARRVEVEITDAAATPADIAVRPGTAITWTNAGSVVQTVVSGYHADFSGESGASSDPGEGEEQPIGFLEGRPR